MLVVLIVAAPMALMRLPFDREVLVGAVSFLRALELGHAGAVFCTLRCGGICRRSTM